MKAAFRLLAILIVAGAGCRSTTPGQERAAGGATQPAVQPMNPITPLLQLVGLGFCIWFGRNGNAWAWQHRRFESIAHFFQVQRVWMIWSVVLFVLWVPMFLVNFGLSMYALVAR